MAIQTVRNALDWLERQGKIKKGEYYLVTKGSKDSKSGTRRAFIVHRGKKPA